MERKRTPSRAPRKETSAAGRAPLFPFLLLFAAALLLIPTLLLPPEGAQRGGDAFLTAFGWLFLAGLGLFSAIASGRKPRAADLAVLLLLVWCGISWFRLKAAHAGNLLHAANGFWTFAIAPLAYFALRALPKRLLRAAESILLAVVVGAALFESTVSLYDYFVTAPTLRAQFREDPEKLLRESGMNLEKGTPEYDLFAKRVLDSVEPLGTYGLTNTLAGLLAPALVLLAGLFPAGAFSRRGESSRHLLFLRISAGAAFLLLGLTLLLTKSRSGYLALFVSAAALPLLSLFSRRAADARRKAALVSGAVLLGGILLAGAALGAGLFDKEVFSEAKKSLGYRLDYWTAA